MYSVESKIYILPILQASYNSGNYDALTPVDIRIVQGGFTFENAFHPVILKGIEDKADSVSLCGLSNCQYLFR